MGFIDEDKLYAEWQEEAKVAYPFSFNGTVPLGVLSDVLDVGTTCSRWPTLLTINLILAALLCTADDREFWMGYRQGCYDSKRLMSIKMWDVE